MNPQPQKTSFLRGLKTALLVSSAAVVLTLSVAPEMAKPLLVKYYRTINPIEPVKTL